MATSIDDNAADEKSDKSKWQLFIIRCTVSICLIHVLPVCCLTNIRKNSAESFVICKANDAVWRSPSLTTTLSNGKSGKDFA